MNLCKLINCRCLFIFCMVELCWG